MTSEEKIKNLEKERDFYKLRLDKIQNLIHEYWKLPHGSDDRNRVLGKIEYYCDSDFNAILLHHMFKYNLEFDAYEEEVSC